MIIINNNKYYFDHLFAIAKTTKLYQRWSDGGQNIRKHISAGVPTRIKSKRMINYLEPEDILYCSMIQMNSCVVGARSINTDLRK